jgi:hypothetical protein
MSKIKIWHCYHYGRHETTIIAAETEDHLRAKVCAVIAGEWDAEDQGPAPDNFDDLMEAYNDYFDDKYFGCWDWSVIDVSLCEEEPESASA